MTAKMPSLTPSQRDAVRWLFEHNGEGTRATKGRVLLAGGEIAPFMHATWARLEALYLVQVCDKSRLRLTPMGRALAEGMDPLPEGYRQND